MFTKTVLGRLKHTTNETCPDCRKSKLQLRAIERPIDYIDHVVSDEQDILYCPSCEYERKVKPEGKKRRKVDDM